MTYLGGPETEEKLLTRHERYLRLGREGEAHMFRIVTPEHPEGVGVIGYWNAVHADTAVYETGWSVESAYQGHGIGTRALVAVLEHARLRRRSTLGARLSAHRQRGVQRDLRQGRDDLQRRDGLRVPAGQSHPLQRLGIRPRTSASSAATRSSVARKGSVRETCGT